LKNAQNDRPRRLQRGDEEGGCIEAALLCRTEYGGEDLLGLRAAGGAIAPAAGLSGDDGRPQGVLGAPVRGVERGVEEEAEDGLEFGTQMGGEGTGVGEPAGPPVARR